MSPAQGLALGRYVLSGRIHRGGDIPPVFCDEAPVGQGTALVRVPAAARRQRFEPGSLFEKQSQDACVGHRGHKTKTELIRLVIAQVTTVSRRSPIRLGPLGQGAEHTPSSQPPGAFMHQPTVCHRSRFAPGVFAPWHSQLTVCPLSRVLQPEGASGRGAVGWGAAAGGGGEMGGCWEGPQAPVADKGLWWSLGEVHCLPLTFLRRMAEGGEEPPQCSSESQLHESLAWVPVTFPPRPVAGPRPW